MFALLCVTFSQPPPCLFSLTMPTFPSSILDGLGPLHEVQVEAPRQDVLGGTQEADQAVVEHLLMLVDCNPLERADHALHGEPASRGDERC